MVRGRRRHAGPVFLDRSGHRRRVLTAIGAGLGAVLIAVMGMFALGLMAGGPGAKGLPGWPDPGAGAGAGPGAPATTAGPTPGPSGAPSPTRPAATAPVVVTGVPTTPAHPGQGDEHRRTPRPTRSPGKPG